MSGSMDADDVSTAGCGPRPQFVFLAIETPDDSKTKDFRRRAKSHAIRQALFKKRKLENRSMPPASAERARDKDAHIPASSPVLLGLPPAPSAASLDPFMSLAADSHRLQELLSLRRFWHDDETNAGQSVEGSLRLTEIYDSVPSHCQAVHRACRQHCR